MNRYIMNMEPIYHSIDKELNSAYLLSVLDVKEWVDSTLWAMLRSCLWLNSRYYISSEKDLVDSIREMAFMEDGGHHRFFTQRDIINTILYSVPVWSQVNSLVSGVKVDAIVYNEIIDNIWIVYGTENYTNRV